MTETGTTPGSQSALREANERRVVDVLRSDGTRTLSDAAFGNLDRPGQPPQTGGNATELWLFTALAPGTVTLTFALGAPGAAPSRTTTYTVRISPNVIVC